MHGGELIAHVADADGVTKADVDKAGELKV